MRTFFLGGAALLFFYVPLLPILLGILALAYGVGPWRAKRRRVLVGIGLACALAGNLLLAWIWTFGHMT